MPLIVLFIGKSASLYVLGVPDWCIPRQPGFDVHAPKYRIILLWHCWELYNRLLLEAGDEVTAGVWLMRF